MNISVAGTGNFCFETWPKPPICYNTNPTLQWNTDAKKFTSQFPKAQFYITPLTSIHLFSRFLTHVCISFPPDIYCCGLLSTRKSDCTGLPQNMLVCGATPAQRGQSRVMMQGTMSLISWYNKGHFRFLTNSYSPTKQGRTETPAACLIWLVLQTHIFFTSCWVRIRFAYD